MKPHRESWCYKVKIDLRIKSALCQKSENVTKYDFQSCWKTQGAKATNIFLLSLNGFLLARLGQITHARFFFFFFLSESRFYRREQHIHRYLTGRDTVVSGYKLQVLWSCFQIYKCELQRKLLTKTNTFPYTHCIETNLKGCHFFLSCCESWWCWNPVTGCVAFY